MNNPDSFDIQLDSDRRVELLLAVLTNLKRYEVVQIADLASQLSMDSDELRAELDNLLYVGVPPFGGGDLLPIEIDEDGMICTTGDMPALTKQLRLSDEEATALLIALRIAGFKSSDLLVEKLTPAVTADFDSETLNQMVHIARTKHDRSIFQTLTLGIDEGRPVEISYTNRAGQTSQRTVEPQSLLAQDDAWYLNGFDHKSKEVRNFRIDRISAAVMGQNQVADNTEDVYATTKALSDAAPSQLMDYDSLPYTCRLVFSNSLAFSPSDWPGAKMRRTKDTGIVVDVPFDNPDWIAHKIMSLHGQAIVQFPEEVKAAVACAAAKKLHDIAV